MIAICLITGGPGSSRRRLQLPHDRYHRVSYASTIATAIGMFINDRNAPGNVTYTVAVSACKLAFQVFFLFYKIVFKNLSTKIIGSNNTDSCLFIRRDQNGRYAFRHFNPTRERMRTAERVRVLLSRRPIEVLGFVPFYYNEESAISVRAEMMYFMRGAYNPFHFPADQFLQFSNRTHNYIYNGRGFGISRL